MTNAAPRILIAAIVALASFTLAGCGDDVDSGVKPAEALTFEQAQTINNRGTVLMDQTLIEEALAVYRELVAGAPRSRDARQNLGVCLLNAEHKDRAVRSARFDEAESIFERIVEEHPTFPNAFYSLGILLEHRGREHGRVLELYARAHALAPEDPDAAYRYGKALYEADEPDYERSLEMLRRAVTAESHFKSAWNALYPTLRRLGRKDEAREAIETFKLYDQFKPEIGRTLKLSYNSMGTLANVVRILQPWEGAAPAGALEPIVPAFTPVASGFRVPPSTKTAESSPWPEGRTLEAGASIRRFILDVVTPALAPGIAVHDLDGDGKREIFVADGRGPGRLFTEGSDGLVDVTKERGIESGPIAVGAVFGDVDHDGHPDLFVYGAGPDALHLNDGKGKLRRVAGCEGGDRVTAAAVMVDADHDGDLDILTAGYLRLPAADEVAAGPMTFPDDFPGAPNALFNNDRPTIYDRDGGGKDAFTEIGQRTGLAGAVNSTGLAGAVDSTGLAGAYERTADVAAFDLDRDGDLDVVFANDGGANRIHRNDRLWRYQEIGAALGLDDAGPARALAPCDVDQDGRVDWFLSRGPSHSCVLIRNRWPGGLEADVSWARALPEDARGGLVFPADIDNDGDPDLIVCSETSGRTLVARNDAGIFTPSISLEESSPVRCVLPLHVDDDGLLDLAAPTPADVGGLQSWINGCKSPHAWVTLALRGKRKLGLADVWSNHFGTGAFVEIADGSRRAFGECGIGGGRGARPVPDVHVGLGDAASIDYLRLLWPDLVLQTEGDLQVRVRHVIDEVNRKSSSCPVLYRRAADGSFEFVTDFLGVGGLGFFLEPGTYATPDETEVVRVGPVAEHDGMLSIRVVEPMEEICYLDRLTLLAVEHDDDVTVHCDERLATSPPAPTGRTLAFRNRHVPVAARNAKGEDVTDSLARRDRRHAGGLVTDPRFIGYLAEEQVLEMEFDREAVFAESDGATGPLWCFVDGWVEYPYSHVNFAAWQAGLRGESFSLDVQSDDGTWTTVKPRFGYPAGMTRTMAVDVTDALAARPRRIRLRTNLHVNVDRVSLARELAPEATDVTRLDFDRAELRWLGYPTEVTPDGRQPTIYAYDQIQERMSWKTMGGRYTSYGDVRDRLLVADDRLVIMNHGEEIALDVKASRLAPLPAGRRRTYFLEAVGWCKDMDPYTATPDTVDPLPWHGMGAYPPSGVGPTKHDGTRVLESTLPLFKGERPDR